jgi:metal-sulfur cluster biosynthetic enzyme
MIDEHEVRLAIYPIQDPELRLSVLDLGLIYGVRVLEEGKKVEVDMTLTSIACPIGPQLQAAVNLVFSPPWDPRSMASEDVQMDLGLL